MLKLEENNRLAALDLYCITGELALSGQLRPVKRVLTIALESQAAVPTNSEAGGDKFKSERARGLPPTRIKIYGSEY
jgi:predicted ATPase with chaperone activity